MSPLQKKVCTSGLGRRTLGQSLTLKQPSYAVTYSESSGGSKSPFVIWIMRAIALTKNTAKPQLIPIAVSKFLFSEAAIAPYLYNEQRDRSFS